MSVHPRSIRFKEGVSRRLAGYVATHEGMSQSSATNLFVDEALRMEEHPGIAFRSGPTGRRAIVAGGPDVWEVVRAVQGARGAEPTLSGAEVVELVRSNTGVSARHMDIALRYWAAFPDEIDSRVADAQRVQTEASAAWARRQALLAR